MFKHCPTRIRSKKFFSPRNGSIRYVTITLVLIHAFILCKNLHSMNTELFTQKYLTVKGKVNNILAEDVNADGFKDLLVIHSDFLFEHNRFQRLLSIFLQSKDGFTSFPSQIIEAHPEDILIDFAPSFPGSGEPRLLILRSDGVFTRSFTNGLLDNSATLLVSTTSLFWAPDPASLHYWNFFREEPEGSTTRLLIPQPKRFDVYTPNDNASFQFTCSYAVHMDVNIGNTTTETSHNRFITTSIFVNEIVTDDFNGDGLDDMAITWEDRIDIYYTQPLSNEKNNPRRAIQPDTRIHFGMTTLHERESTDNTSLRILSRVLDINNDGLADIIISKTDKGDILNSLGQVQIFLNRKGSFNNLPDHVFTIENFSGDVILMDFNNDSLVDIGLLTSKFSIFNMAKLLLFRKLRCDLSIYLMRDNFSFSKKAEVTKNFSYTIDLKEVLTTAPFYTLLGDYNCDSLRDLLVETGIDKISIYWGQSNQLFSAEDEERINANISPFFLVKTLNEDTKSDLIFWYPLEKDFEGSINVLLSK